METMAAAYGDLGVWTRAETLQRSARWRFGAIVFGENHPDFARSVDLLAEVLQGRATTSGAETRFGKKLCRSAGVWSMANLRRWRPAKHLSYVLKLQGQVQRGRAAVS